MLTVPLYRIENETVVVVTRSVIYWQQTHKHSKTHFCFCVFTVSFHFIFFWLVENQWTKPETNKWNLWQWLLYNKMKTCRFQNSTFCMTSWKSFTAKYIFIFVICRLYKRKDSHCLFFFICNILFLFIINAALSEYLACF